MRARIIVAVLIAMATAACSTHRIEFDANPSYAPHYFRKSDLEVAWQAERTGQDIHLSGTVTNRRYGYLRDLELTARVLDEKGRVLAKESFADFPSYIPSGKGEPFHLAFHLPAGTSPTRLRFNYTYWLTEEPPAFMGYGGYSDDGYDDTPHFGNFDAPL